MTDAIDYRVRSDLTYRDGSFSEQKIPTKYTASLVHEAYRTMTEFFTVIAARLR